MNLSERLNLAHEITYDYRMLEAECSCGLLFLGHDYVSQVLAHVEGK